MSALVSSEMDRFVVEVPQNAAPAADVYAFPPSPAQDRIWRADQKQPGNSAYNASFRWVLEGQVDPSILERAFNEIIRRHEILRATFRRSSGGASQQLIAPSSPISIKAVDLRSL